MASLFSLESSFSPLLVEYGSKEIQYTHPSVILVDYYV